MRWVAAAAATAGVAVAAAVLMLVPAAAPAVVEAGQVPLAAPVTPALEVGERVAGVPAGSTARASDITPAPASTTGAVVSTSVDAGAQANPTSKPATGRLTIPALNINAPVVSVATGPDGVLHPPADVTQIGRWAGGAAPGDPDGTVVLTGHLDSRTGGKGALYSVGRARPGQEITVGDTTYNVTAIRSYSKRVLPADIWSTNGQHRLVLITCGGKFTDGHYESNVVVYALPTAR